MSANGWLQLVLILGGLMAVTKPLGIYLVRVLDPEHEGPTFLDRVARAHRALHLPRHRG